MALLLTRNRITIVRPSGLEDEHGWVVGAADDDLIEVDVVQGSMQWTLPTPEPTMTENGNGPFAPTLTYSAMAYLPEGTDVRAGDILVTDDYPDVVVQTLVTIMDPRPSGMLDAIEARCVEVKQPEDGS